MSVANRSVGPLSGVNVLEYGQHISGPFCARTLADLGADVIKVEPPSGDPSRTHGPFPADEPDPEKSGLFLFLNANKRGVTLDIGLEDDHARLLELVEWADVFIENFPPHEIDALGLDYDALKIINPRLIVTSITPFGRTGPYRNYKAYDLNISAAGGMSYGTGFPDREPLATPLQQSSFFGGFSGALATVIALLAQESTGDGQLVDISEAQASAVLLNGYHLPTYIYKGIPGRRWGNRMSLGLFPNCVLPAKDGYICIDTPQLAQYQRFLALLGEQTWSQEPKYRNRRAMTEEYPEEAEALIAPWFKARTKEEIFKLSRENRIPCVPVKTISESLEEPHLRERGFWQTLTHPKAGSLTYPGAPYRFKHSPWQLLSPAPTLGEHNREVFQSLESSSTTRQDHVTRNDNDSLPLNGYRVLDFGSAWAAPMAAQILADLGAEVIKIESRSRMDGMRLGRPIIGEDIAGGDEGKWPELQPVYHSLNRNKQSITVDLKQPDGVNLIKDLVAQSDVVINNYSPGVMDRLGLSYQTLRTLRPDIIFVTMPAAGDSGPLSDILAYAPIVLALTGLMGMVGYEDGSLVGELQSAWSDAVAAMTAAMAMTTSIRHRMLTGHGQSVEVPQWEATTSWLGEAVMDWTMNHREFGPQGNANQKMAPHNTYPCNTSDSWVSIAVLTDEEWSSLRTVIRDNAGSSAPSWTSDPRFDEISGRQHFRHDLDKLLSEWTRQYSPIHITELLQAHGVAAFPVMNIEDQFLDPQLRDRDAWVEMEHPMVGIEWLYGQPWRLSKTPGSVRRHAPLLGEHNKNVFVELLGHSDKSIKQLIDRDIVH
ncbi:CoA transferase [Dehalococcoidia bacterium]|nr:CoA transferase [Dehalococcoidia bacterium]